MKILHCCLSCFYIDNYSYQENLLPIINMKHGHEVSIIASTETFTREGKLGYVSPAEYNSAEGIKITRVPYRKILPGVVMKKIRSYKGVYSLISSFSPDIIMFHGIPAYELITVVKYIKEHPNVKLYVDSHEDFNNSATNFVSKFLLHELFYRKVIKRCLPYINKIFYITAETKEFISKEYRIPENMMEFYPLGGEIILADERLEWRRKIRKELGIDDATIVLMHSGKLDVLKRTDVIIEGLNKVQSDKVLLLIAGTVPPENARLKQIINGSKKTKWLGWLNAEELRHYLCASDIYIQPGGQSATAQNAMCCGLPVMLYPHKSYVALCRENVMWVKDEADIYKAISELLEKPHLLRKLGDASVQLAESVLDYNVLASKIEK